MNRKTWQAEFDKSWSAKTILWNKDNPSDPAWKNDADVDPDYIGIDYSVDNMWIDTNSIPQTYHFGSPYRKEVSPDDILGTFQTQSFWMEDGIVTKQQDGYGSANFTTLDGHYAKLEDGMDLFEMFPNPIDAVNAFRHETGMMY